LPQRAGVDTALREKVYLDVRDATISKPGKIGLWTKADAQTRFAALTVTDP